jgi:Phosphotransferase enzyme family
VLRAKGVLPASAHVLSAEARQFGEEEGFTWGALYRISLRYDRLTPSAPTTVVAKLAPQDPALRQMMKQFNARETGFYQRLDATDGLPLPLCFHADCDPGSGASILLLQDLTFARRVPFVTGCNGEDALRVVDAMAAIHARWWNSPTLLAAGGSDLLEDLPFRRFWAEYPARLRKILPDVVLPGGFLRLGDALAEREGAVLARLMDAPPFTRLHRDLHVDNVMFVPGATGETAILLDWQLCGRGRGACDLAYFLISSLDPGLRRKMEETAIVRLSSFGDLQTSRHGCGHSDAGQ